MTEPRNQPTKRAEGVKLQTIIGVLAGLYGASPIDVMPEALLGPLGYGDDVVVIALAVLLMLAVTLADRGGAQ